MTRLISKVRPALAAALIVAALEPAERSLSVEASRFAVRPSLLRSLMFSRDVWAADVTTRRCGSSGQGLVLFTGGSPSKDLDLALLSRELAPHGARPCIAAFAGGLRPAEMQAYLPELLALRPRVLVLHVGAQTFAPYERTFASRLTYFHAERVLPFLSLEQAWALRGQLARSLAARAFTAFRYRHILRSLVRPELYVNDREGPSRFADLDSGRPDRFDLAPGVQLWMFDDFLARWRRTGIPLIVWDSPRETTGQVAGRLDPPNKIRTYLAIVRDAERRRSFVFVGPERLPAFPLEEFKSTTHFTAAGGTRMARVLVPYIRAALGAGPTPVPQPPGGTPRGTAEEKPKGRIGQRTGR